MKSLKVLGGISLLIFSFYYVDQVSNLSISKNKLFQEITYNALNYNIKPVNAVIKDNKIIPGLNGKNVDIKKSYYKMKTFKIFNEYFLVYNEQEPDISLKNNMDKIICEGNSLKNQVSFIVDNSSIANYMIQKKIKGSILITKESLKKESFLEQINNDIENYKLVDNQMKHYNINNSLCFYDEKIILLCKNKFLITYNKALNSVNIVDVKSNVKPGMIFYISNDANLEDFKILVQEIKYRNINIVYLSELIKEQRD